MQNGSVADLVGELRQCRLLDPRQLEQVSRTLQPRCADARTLAGHLVKQGWLTAFQVNQLLQGRGEKLVLGRYVLLERMGDGGMGKAFKARHHSLRRLVTLVVLAEELLAQPEAQERFYRDIQAASRLTHPNVVTAFDAGPVGGTHFFALEHVEGTDLERLVAEAGPLEVGQACSFVRQAALALQHAAEQGLLHHDLTPANLLVLRPAKGHSGFHLVKIRNLGLTFLRQPARATRLHRSTPGLPVIVGSPDYAAPELAGQAPVTDVRAEIYSLGCVFYYLLSGRVPFPGGSAVEKVSRHRRETPVPIETCRADVPVEIQDILNRLLAKDPAERFQTPAEVADALAAFDAPPVAAKASTVGRVSMALSLAARELPGQVHARPWLWINLAGATLLLGLLLMFLGLLNRGGDRAEGRTAEENARRELNQLMPLLDDGATDRDALRGRLLGLRTSYPATAAGREVGRLLPRLPSALDGLNESAVPGPGRPAWLPREVVGVIGDYPTSRPLLDPLSVCPALQLVAVRSPEGHIQVYHIVTGKLLATVKDPGTPALQHAVLSPDGKCLAVVGNDASVRIWDLSGSARERGTLPGKLFASLTALAFTPDGGTLATIQPDMMVRFWDVTSTPTARPETLKAQEGQLLSLAYSPDGQTLAIGCGDRGVRLFDFGKRRVKQTLVNVHPDAPPLSMVFAPDGRSLATLVKAPDNAVKVWDVATGKELAVVSRPGFQPAHLPQGLGFDPSGRTLAVLGRDGAADTGPMTLLLWDVKTNQERLVFPRAAGIRGFPMLLVDVGPQGRTVTTWGADQALRLWDGTVGQERAILKAHGAGLSAAALAPDGRTVVAGGLDGGISFWDATTHQRQTFNAHRLAVKTLAIAPDGRAVATASFDRTVRLWELPNKGESRTIADLQGYATALAYAPDGQALAVGSSDATVTLWDPTRRKHLATLDASAGWVNALSFAPDGRSLVAGGSDGGLRLWQLTGTRTRHEARSNGEVLAVAHSADGATLAVAGRGTPNLQLWDLTSGNPTAGVVLDEHSGPVRGVAFSSDGKWLASSGEDCTVLLWRRDKNTVQHRWQYGVPVTGVGFASDGRHLLTLNADGTAYVLRLP